MSRIRKYELVPEARFAESGRPRVRAIRCIRYSLRIGERNGQETMIFSVLHEPEIFRRSRYVFR